MLLVFIEAKRTHMPRKTRHFTFAMAAIIYFYFRCFARNSLPARTATGTGQNRTEHTTQHGTQQNKNISERNRQHDMAGAKGNCEQATFRRSVVHKSN